MGESNGRAVPGLSVIGLSGFSWFPTPSSIGDGQEFDIGDKDCIRGRVGDESGVAQRSSASLRSRFLVASVSSRQSIPFSPATSAHKRLRLAFGWCCITSRKATTGPRRSSSAIVVIPASRSHWPLRGPRLRRDSMGSSAVITLPPQFPKLRLTARPTLDAEQFAILLVVRPQAEKIDGLP